MTTATRPVSVDREPELLGQTVVVIGGSAGIGFETARRARTEGARGRPHRTRPGPARASRGRTSVRKQHGLRRERLGGVGALLPATCRHRSIT